MANKGDTNGMWGHTHYGSHVERLCAYIKNDSVVRWHLGCNQAAVDYARAQLAKRPQLGHGYVNKSARTDELTEERQRAKRAAAGNKAYLRAVAALVKC